MKAIGLQQPIAVSRQKSGKYKIIDGHRRYRCAREMQIAAVPCRIYPELQPGDLERIRYEIQNNRRPWKPLERADALARIKKSTSARTNKELAELLFISETLVSNSLRLKEQKDDYKAMMEDYGLSGSYQVEFVKLLPKLRPIGEFETVDEIVEIIFKKIQFSVIGSAKDLRTLGKIFLRATANKEHLLEFLRNDDLTVKTLELDTVQSGFSLQIEKVIERIENRQKKEISFSEKEEILMRELQRLLQEYFSQLIKH